VQQTKILTITPDLVRVPPNARIEPPLGSKAVTWSALIR